MLLRPGKLLSRRAGGCWATLWRAPVRPLLTATLSMDLGAEGGHQAADRLQTLGPRAIIASLSLGATRTFRISRARPRGRPDAAEVGPASDGAGGGAPAAAAGQNELSSVDIPLPHNTLVIMWPPMQEEWKHEVRSPAQLLFARGTAALAAVLTGRVVGRRCPSRRACSRTRCPAACASI